MSCHRVFLIPSKHDESEATSSHPSTNDYENILRPRPSHFRGPSTDHNVFKDLDNHNEESNNKDSGPMFSSSINSSPFTHFRNNNNASESPFGNRSCSSCFSKPTSTFFTSSSPSSETLKNNSTITTCNSHRGILSIHDELDDDVDQIDDASSPFFHVRHRNTKVRSVGGIRISPFEPIVCDRNYPSHSAGKVSPLPMMEYEAWNNARRQKLESALRGASSTAVPELRSFSNIPAVLMEEDNDQRQGNLFRPIAISPCDVNYKVSVNDSCNLSSENKSITKSQTRVIVSSPLNDCINDGELTRKRGCIDDADELTGCNSYSFKRTHVENGSDIFQKIKNHSDDV